MICRHKNFKNVNLFDKISLNECKDCGLIFSDKYKSGFDPAEVYSNYYRNVIVGRFIYGIEYIVKLFRFFRAFKLYTINPSAKSILDIGSGRGFMLYFLKKYYGYKITAGTQLERNSYEFSKNRLDLEIYNKDLLDIRLKKNNFDFVTIWHVLEHVKFPEKYLRRARLLLKKGGKLVIEVPNYDSWTRRLTGRYWLGLDLKYHLYFFNNKSLSTLLRRSGYKIVDSRTFSLEYSTFISVQSIVSSITKTDQLFFNWIQGGKFRLEIIFHAILIAFLAPFCLLINLVLYRSDSGEVLLLIAENK